MRVVDVAVDLMGVAVVRTVGLLGFIARFIVDVVKVMGVTVPVLVNIFVVVAVIECGAFEKYLLPMTIFEIDIVVVFTGNSLR